MNFPARGRINISIQIFYIKSWCMPSRKKAETRARGLWFFLPSIKASIRSNSIEGKTFSEYVKFPLCSRFAQNFSRPERRFVSLLLLLARLCQDESLHTFSRPLSTNYVFKEEGKSSFKSTCHTYDELPAFNIKKASQIGRKIRQKEPPDRRGKGC